MSHIPVKLIFLMLFCAHAFQATAQKDSLEIFRSGQQLFRTNCSACHNVHREFYGPMLASITKKRDPDWLVAFIQNSQKMILAGDEYSAFLFEQYNQSVMPSFEKLSEKQIREILFYLEKESENPVEKTVYFPESGLSYDRKNAVAGKIIFEKQCASCHLIGKDAYGPSLGSVTKRRPADWLVRFIKNAQQVIGAGDPYAVYLYESYDKKSMPSFEYLEEEEILSVLDYIGFASSSPPTVAGSNGRKTLPHPASKLTSPAHLEPPEQIGTGFKIVFMIMSVIGALFHIYIIRKLYKYLRRRKEEN